MAHLKSPATVRAAARDLRRDWSGWSRSERVTASLVGAGIVALAAFATLPW